MTPDLAPLRDGRRPPARRPEAAGPPRGEDGGPAAARVPGLPVAIALELVAFSLPAARGDWGAFGLAAAALGLAAAGLRDRRLQLGRAVLAAGAAARVGNPVLGGLQVAVALGWLFAGARPALVAAPVAAGLLAPLAYPGLPDARVPGTVDVVTWNRGSARGPRWELHFAVRFRNAPPDLIALQELGYAETRPGRESWDTYYDEDRAAVARLSSALGMPYVWSDLPMGYRRAPQQSGVVLLARHPLRVLPRTDLDSAGTPPPAFVVEDPAGEYVVSPFHLWSPDFCPLPARREALRVLLGRLPKGRPRVVLGDTNMAPLDRFDLPGAAGYRDAGRAGRGYGGTWPAGFPLARIDATFVSPEWEVLDSRPIAMGDSDHLPVWTRLRRRPPVRSVW